MEKAIVYWHRFPDYTPPDYGRYIVSDGSSVYTALWTTARFVHFDEGWDEIEDKTIKAWLSLPQIPDFLK